VTKTRVYFLLIHSSAVYIMYCVVCRLLLKRRFWSLCCLYCVVMCYH